jgi:uncharacterized protein YhjY with autotransporter beta-barrel domain
MQHRSARHSARLRSVLCASAALASLTIAANARAQAVGPVDPGAGAASEAPTNAYRAPQGGGGYATVTAPVIDVAPDPQIVIANPNTPTTARDPDNITGVGQMVTDTGGGFIGLCTATLINPRTVVFAAHCVNDEAANAYGAASGGTPIGFGFSNNNLSGIQSWYFSGSGQYQTNAGKAFYNSNYVSYNPGSLEPNANQFLYSDVAVASLDTPAKGIPTWALLFSPLPDPGTIGASGTGYHVVVDGYGNNGTGTSGSTGGIDFRRRIAENMVGGLASIDEFENFLFGGNSTTNPQNLYWIDFDDPRRGTASASPFDFNAWRDNAVADGKEGITASGDSGGPLILDNSYARQLVIGVLSGGYTRFFNGQPANGYGTASFYQPLYLYWDWIAANNPYHYVSAVAGNGKWSDPNHWVTNLDPNYYVLDANGQLINGVPTTPGAGNTDQPGFGQACFQSGGISDCLDISTGSVAVTATPTGQSADQVGAAASGAPTDDAGRASLLSSGLSAQAGNTGAAAAALPAATLANGLPGASGFVPNNDDGDRLTSTAPRYFDVTLSAAGTTTLDTNATVDRFTIAGGNSALNITSAGSLTSLIDVSQITGSVQVDGLLSTPGDYFMMTGGLSGAGTVRAAYFTNAAGVIAPGTPTTIGTLTFQGNLVLSSGSVLLMNLGPNGTSDKIAVSTTTFSAPGVAVDGIAALAGSVVFSPVSDYTIRSGDTYQILTAQGGLTGTFNTTPLSAILTPTFAYSATDVKVKIVAGNYVDVVSPTSPVQLAFAKLLDGDRTGSYDPLAGLYGPLDLQSQATIRSTLESWAPRTETLKTALGTVATDNMARFYRDRLDALGTSDMGGTVAIIGQPLSVAANLNNVGPIGSFEPGAAGAPQVTAVSTGKVPDDVSVFFAGGYLNGDSAPMSTAIPAGGRDNFDGWYGAAGIEKRVSSIVTLGFAASYTNVQGNTTTGATAKGDLYQGTFYGKVAWPGGVTVDGVFSAGLFDTHAVRTASLVGTPYTLRSNDQSLALSGELGVSWKADLGGLKLGPRAAIRRSSVGFSDTVEEGGPMALRLGREDANSTQGRIGLTLGGAKGKVRPFLTGYYVHDFENAPASFGANFVGGIGPAAQFALAGRDKDWWEVSGGLALDMNNVTLSVGADTTIDRTDVKNQSYRGSITFRF